MVVTLKVRGRCRGGGPWSRLVVTAVAGGWAGSWRVARDACAHAAHTWHGSTGTWGAGAAGTGRDGGVGPRNTLGRECSGTLGCWAWEPGVCAGTLGWEARGPGLVGRVWARCVPLAVGHWVGAGAGAGTGTPVAAGGTVGCRVAAWGRWWRAGGDGRYSGRCPASGTVGLWGRWLGDVVSAGAQAP